MSKRLPLEKKIDPKTSALIVVDVQNDFVSLQGAFGRWGEDMTMIQEMVPKLKELIEEARAARVPIIYFKNTSSPWTNSQVHTERIAEVRGKGGQEITIEGTWGAEFYEGICPREDERVVVKHRYSGFIDTDLDLILRSLGIKTLIMTGVATNVCVESTSRDGFMKDFRIIFVKDCSATTEQKLHEGTLENIERYFGTVVSAKEIISIWSGLAG